MDAPTPDTSPSEHANVAPPIAAAGSGPALKALAAGLLCGVFSWLACEGILESYRAALNPRMRREVDADDSRRFANAYLVSTSATFAAMGSILGLGLGLAGGLARRSAESGLGAGLAGGVAGAIAAGATSFLVLPYFVRNHDPNSPDMVLPLVTLGSICSAAGAAGGLAFGIGLGGRGRWAKALVGGLLGAALATVAYEVVGGIAFPADKTELPISLTHATRAMLHVLVAVGTAAGAALALDSGKRQVASPGA